jgi:hypothetical protein
MEKRGVGRMHRLYSEAEAEVSSKLRALVRRGKGDTFTAHHYRMVLVQVRDGVHQFEQRLAAHMGREGRTAGLLAHRHLVKEIKAASQTFAGHTPVLRAEQAAVAQGVFSRQEPSLLRRYESSARLYGPPAIKRMEGQMALSLTSGETVGEAVDRVATTFGDERWRAERIVRTEMSYSYGVVKQAGMEGLAAELPHLQKKLVATHDDRTGKDSLQLDGQTVDVGKPFVWEVKTDKGMPTGEVKRYMQPPNRPNDREIVIPWRREWGGSIGGEQGAVAPAEL